MIDPRVARPNDVLRDNLALDALDGLSDMLTVIMSSLEQLARQPLTTRGIEQVRRADLAARHAGRILWWSMDPDGTLRE